MGLDVPVTIDDWTELFDTAKDNGFNIPFTCSSEFIGVDAVELFNSAYHARSKTMYEKLDFFLIFDKILF